MTVRPLRVSFVIPAFNEANLITRAVESARAAGAFEVIVADGGSVDETGALAAAAGAVVVDSRRGRAAQQNAGAAAAAGEVLLFQHADNWCDGSTVAQIRAALGDKRRLGGAFQQKIDADGILFLLIEWGNAQRVRWFRMAYGDQGIFLRRQTFEAIGGFDDVPLMEDVLLMQKLRRLARPVLLPGPHHVSARRWQRHGVIGQTLRNWYILMAHACGASPDALAKHYRRHDAGGG